MADGSRHSMRMVPEVAYGVTPNTPVFKPVRHTGTTLGLTKDSLQSEEIRDDRQIADFRHGARQTGGDISIELSFGSFDDILEATLMGSWIPDSTTGKISLSATATGVTRTAGDFTAEGFVIGDTVTLSGFTEAGNSGLFKVATVAALTLTLTPLSGQVQEVETAAIDRVVETVRGKLKAGTIRRSFTLERYFGDIQASDKPFHRFSGVEFNSLALAINANAMITGTVGVVGKEMSLDTTMLVGATYGQPTTTSPLDSFTGTLKESGTTIAVITEIQLTLENGLDPRFVVGSKSTIRPSVGRSNVTGQVTAYFENSTLLEKFINETESSIEFDLPDGAGNNLKFIIPRIKYNGGQPDVQGEGPITLSMPFQSILDSVTGTNIILERNPA